MCIGLCSVSTCSQIQGYETYCRIRRNFKTFISVHLWCFRADITVSEWKFSAFRLILIQLICFSQFFRSFSCHSRAVINGSAVPGLIGMHWVSTRKGQCHNWTAELQNSYGFGSGFEPFPTSEIPSDTLIVFGTVQKNRQCTYVLRRLLWPRSENLSLMLISNRLSLLMSWQWHVSDLLPVRHLLLSFGWYQFNFCLNVLKNYQQLLEFHFRQKPYFITWRKITCWKVFNITMFKNCLICTM